MKRFVAILLLAGCALVASAKDTGPEILYKMTCAVLADEMDLRKPCKGVPAPLPVISHIVEDHKWNTLEVKLKGLHYRNEPYIFIRPGMPDMDAVYVHETVHYILYNILPDMSHCGSERLARKVTDSYLGVDYTADWEKLYGCEGVS